MSVAPHYHNHYPAPVLERVQQSGRPVTVVAAHPSYSPHSLLQRMAMSPLAQRAQRYSLLLSALLCLAVLGSAAALLRMETSYQATAQASLPMSITLSDTMLLKAAIQRLKWGNAAGVTLTLQQFPASQILVITASAPKAADAALLANTAVDIAAARDRSLWASAIAQPATANPALLNEPLASVVQSADAQSTAPIESFSWSARHLIWAASWVCIMIGIAALLLFAPERAQADRVGNRIFRFARASKTAKTAVPMEGSANLPVLAGVLLTPDFMADRPGMMRPVLMDVDTALWTALTGRSGSVSESVGALPGAAREFLFTRPLEEGAGSRAAVLALGRALAQRGIPTVLVDADLAAGSAQRDEFGLPEDAPGVAQILMGRQNLEDCLLIDDEYPGLSAVTAGWDSVSEADAERLLASAEFLDFLDVLSAGHSVVLIHGPAAAAAAPTIGVRTEATVLVTPEQLSKAEREAERRGLAALAAAQANVIGRVEICSHAGAAVGV